MGKNDITRIFLIRHGETLWNNEYKCQGHTNIDLSEVGRQQAQLLANSLKDIPFAAGYSSDLSRAKETADIIARHHNISVQTHFNLRETKFGQWEGMDYNKIKDHYPEECANWTRNPLETYCPDGECLKDVFIRSDEVIKELVNKHNSQTIYVVTHGGTIKALIANVLGMSLNNYWKIRQDNTAVNIIEYYDNKTYLSLLNCTCHLNKQE